MMENHHSLTLPLESCKPDYPGPELRFCENRIRHELSEGEVNGETPGLISVFGSHLLRFDIVEIFAQ